MESNNRKIGLISTMAPGDTWDKAIIERVARRHGELKKLLTDMGYETADDGPLHRTYGQMKAAGKNLRAQDIKALVIFVGTWTHSNAAAEAAAEAGVPVVVWGDAAPGSCGLVGSTITMGAMDEMGIYANLVYGPFDDEATLSRARLLLDAACAATSLRGTTLGVGGGRCMGMLTAVCDPNDIKKKFGVEIDSFEQMALIDLAETIEQGRVEHFLGWMKNTFGKITAKPEAVEKQIRLYIAVKDFCDKMGYDFVALKCLPEMAAKYTSYCLAHAILGDGCDDLGEKPRFVMSCEADIPAALTMQILKNLVPESPVLFTDLTEYDFTLDLLTTCNCGSQPTDFAADKKEVYWEKEGVHEHYWKYGGACPQHVAKSGRATVARLGRKNGRYELMIAPVEIVEMPREKLKETVWERPHAYLKLLCDRTEFFSNARANHVHMVYGDHIAGLTEVCNVLGIKPVIVK